MSHYLHGIDCVVGDAGTGGAPSLPLDPEDFGPATGGTHYTDAGTIRAVQQALKAKGYDPGSVDGVFGPNTEAAIYKFGGVHGPPDDTMLARLGVVPGGLGGGTPPTKKALSSSQGYVDLQNTGRGFIPGAPPQRALAPVAAGFWMQPAWDTAPVKRWQLAVGGVGAVAILTGLIAAVVRR